MINIESSQLTMTNPKDILNDNARLSRRGLLKSVGLAAVASATPMASAQTSSGTSGAHFVYIGCYTGNGKGIYVFRSEPFDGGLVPVGIANGVSNPSFLALHPNRQFLYCCNENTVGSVTSFAINPTTGLLTQLNMQPTQGANPASLSVHPSGKFVLAANYSGASIIAFPVNTDGSLGSATDFRMHTGALGPNTGRQEAPHPHFILTDPSGKWVLVNDLGQDLTYIYAFDPAVGKFVPSPTPSATHDAGSGPRHFAFHPNGGYFYSCSELSNTVDFFVWDSGAGSLTWRQTLSSLPPGYVGVSNIAEVVVGKSGKHLYVSNRGYDSIAIFDLDEGSGYMGNQRWAWCGGETPRNFNIDPDGGHLYAANQNSNNIVVLDIEKGGKISAPNQFVDAGNPVCVLFR
jgi:6-phosphogluconolactonase